MSEDIESAVSQYITEQVLINTRRPVLVVRPNAVETA